MRYRYKVYLHFTIVAVFSLICGLVSVFFVFMAIVEQAEGGQLIIIAYWFILFVFFFFFGWKGNYNRIKEYKSIYNQVISALVVPDSCSECDESLYSDEVELIEPHKTKCPHCGFSFKVTTYWDEHY